LLIVTGTNDERSGRIVKRSRGRSRGLLATREYEIKFDQVRGHEKNRAIAVNMFDQVDIESNQLRRKD
jgi:hypothetical protein